MSKKVVCFGEMLWDCFQDEEIPGGAPMNVALHLNQLGLDVKLISRLGMDSHGERLLDFIRFYKLNTDLVQIDPFISTGTVSVNNINPENIKYNITYPAAWDYVELTESNCQAVKEADAFIFGSLGVRNSKSWNTFYHLLHFPGLKIFDINLRPPYYDFEQIKIILGYTDILKINEDELIIIADYFDLAISESHDDILETASLICTYLCNSFSIIMICVTLGSKGALIYENRNIYKHPGYKIKVIDTVGAGDAFLSGFVKSYLDGKQPEDVLNFACALGAFLASNKGGTPKYQTKDILSKFRIE